MDWLADPEIQAQTLSSLELIAHVASAVLMLPTANTPVSSRSLLTGAISFSLAMLLSGCAAHRSAAPTPPPASFSSSIPADIPQAGTKGYTNPNCVYCPTPQYTGEAMRHKIQGLVILEVVIGADGRAHEAVVTKSLGYGLDEEAIHAVRDVWRFKPALGPDGKPAAVRMLIEIDFHLY